MGSILPQVLLRGGEKKKNIGREFRWRTRCAAGNIHVPQSEEEQREPNNLAHGRDADLEPTVPIPKSLRSVHMDEGSGSVIVSCWAPCEQRSVPHEVFVITTRR